MFSIKLLDKITHKIINIFNIKEFNLSNIDSVAVIVNKNHLNITNMIQIGNDLRIVFANGEELFIKNFFIGKNDLVFNEGFSSSSESYYYKDPSNFNDGKNSFARLDNLETLYSSKTTSSISALQLALGSGIAVLGIAALSLANKKDKNDNKITKTESAKPTESDHIIQTVQYQKADSERLLNAKISQQKAIGRLELAREAKNLADQNFENIMINQKQDLEDKQKQYNVADSALQQSLKAKSNVEGWAENQEQATQKVLDALDLQYQANLNFAKAKKEVPTEELDKDVNKKVLASIEEQYNADSALQQSLKAKSNVEGWAENQEQATQKVLDALDLQYQANLNFAKAKKEVPTEELDKDVNKKVLASIEEQYNADSALQQSLKAKSNVEGWAENQEQATQKVLDALDLQYQANLNFAKAKKEVPTEELDKDVNKKVLASIEEQYNADISAILTIENFKHLESYNNNEEIKKGYENLIESFNKYHEDVILHHPNKDQYSKSEQAYGNNFYEFRKTIRNQKFKDGSSQALDDLDKALIDRIDSEKKLSESLKEQSDHYGEAAGDINNPDSFAYKFHQVGDTYYKKLSEDGSLKDAEQARSEAKEEWTEEQSNVSDAIVNSKKALHESNSKLSESLKEQSDHYGEAAGDINNPDSFAYKFHQVGDTYYKKLSEDGSLKDAEQARSEAKEEWTEEQSNVSDAIVNSKKALHESNSKLSESLKEQSDHYGEAAGDINNPDSFAYKFHQVGDTYYKKLSEDGSLKDAEQARSEAKEEWTEEQSNVSDAIVNSKKDFLKASLEFENAKKLFNTEFEEAEANKTASDQEFEEAEANKTAADNEVKEAKAEQEAAQVSSTKPQARSIFTSDKEDESSLSIEDLIQNKAANEESFCSDSNLFTSNNLENDRVLNLLNDNINLY